MSFLARLLSARNSFERSSCCGLSQKRVCRECGFACGQEDKAAGVRDGGHVLHVDLRHVEVQLWLVEVDWTHTQQDEEGAWVRTGHGQVRVSESNQEGGNENELGMKKNDE